MQIPQSANVLEEKKIEKKTKNHGHVFIRLFDANGRNVQIGQEANEKQVKFGEAVIKKKQETETDKKILNFDGYLGVGSRPGDN